jgi:uncharacterized protein YndB with AHSA1/START domain
VPEILHELLIEQSEAHVFGALTEQSGIRGWFTRYAEARPEVGSVIRLGFAGQVKFEMRIDAIDPNERVAWTCLSGHPEWEGTTVEFALGDVPGKRGWTRVRFAHRGWKTSDGVLAQCSYDWAQYLRSLKLFVEKGKGTPS